MKYTYAILLTVTLSLGVGTAAKADHGGNIVGLAERIARTLAATYRLLDPRDVQTIEADLRVVQRDLGEALLRVGKQVGGSYWFLGDLGQSCSQVCRQFGLDYDEATKFFAGSAGSDQNCGRVLDAFNLAIGQHFEPKGNIMNEPLGCIYVPSYTNKRRRAARVETREDASNPQAQRACACRFF